MTKHSSRKCASVSSSRSELACVSDSFKQETVQSMHMTLEAKGRLSDTIRALRTRLLEELHSATESAYRMSVRARDAGLAQAARVRRARLEAWVDEQVRTEAARGERQRTPDAFRREVEKQAAYTLLNRLVV